MITLEKFGHFLLTSITCFERLKYFETLKIISLTFNSRFTSYESVFHSFLSLSFETCRIFLNCKNSIWYPFVFTFPLSVSSTDESVRSNMRGWVISKQTWNLRIQKNNKQRTILSFFVKIFWKIPTVLGTCAYNSTYVFQDKLWIDKQEILLI